MDEEESITKELRAYVSHCISNFVVWPDPMSDIKPGEWVTRDGILGKLDRIDARFDSELRAKRDEVEALKYDNADLQARLDASIPLPVDADGVPCKPGDMMETDEHIPRKVVGYYLADESTPCVTLEFVSPSIESNRLRHVAPEPPETIEDVRDDAMFNDFSECKGCVANMTRLVNRACVCGRRDGAGEAR